MQSGLLAHKDSWTPCLLVALQSGLNCAGNIYLICYCRMGIAAAAWASVASQYVGLIGLAAALQRTPVRCP